MITQKFKGDETELKMEAAGALPLSVCSSELDDMYEGCYSAGEFLLMLYDEGRAPFSDRVPRESFIAFLREALQRFPFIGTFESYIFIIEAIFGDGSGVQFDVPAPGKLEMLVNATSLIPFDFIARELVDGAYIEHQMIDSDGNLLQFQGIAGIDSEYELAQLLAEIIPAGIFPAVTLAFYAIYDFIAEDTGTDYSMIDHLGNQIVFIEVGA